jgi:hypothetical protein
MSQGLFPWLFFPDQTEAVLALMPGWLCQRTPPVRAISTDRRCTARPARLAPSRPMVFIGQTLFPKG